MMRIWFFGTPALAAWVLRDLISSSEIEVVFIVTNPDKPIGRTSELRPSPVKLVALEKWISLFQPWKVRGNEAFLSEIKAYQCDYFVVVAYGKILSLELLEIPKKMCINVHGSLLPKYRGASPIQAALLFGEKETGVTIMKMSEGMDEGDILKMRTITIAEDETSESLFEKFAKISGPTLIQTLLELEHGGITSLPQNHEEATYCKKIEKEDGLIDWSKSAKEIYQMWQGFTPWPGIYTMYEGKRLLLESVSVIPGLSRNPENLKESFSAGFLHSQEWQKQGQVVRLEDGNIGVICGEWVLTLEQVKLEWKKSQSIKDFVNGNQKFIWNLL
jgi:methionyl-tRNA formyltransferase